MSYDNSDTIKHKKRGIETSVIIKDKTISNISLSYNGSTLSFVSAQFIKIHRAPMMGVGVVP